MRLTVGAASVALAAAITVAGCGSPSEPTVRQLAQDKWGTGEVQREVGPMADRVPAVREAVAVAYTGGPRAEPDGAREVTAPGPTDLWIDAVVTFAPDDPAPARECGVAGPQAEPDVVSGLAEELTEGPWLVCASGSFAAPDWDVAALLDVESNVVVVHLVGR